MLVSRFPRTGSLQAYLDLLEPCSISAVLALVSCDFGSVVVCCPWVKGHSATSFQPQVLNPKSR